MQLAQPNYTPIQQQLNDLLKSSSILEEATTRRNESAAAQPVDGALSKRKAKIRKYQAERNAKRKRNLAALKASTHTVHGKI